MKMTKEKLTRFLKMMWLDTYQRDLDGFSAKFKEDPADALYWSGSVFTAAAKVEVAKYVLDSMTGKATPESVREYARDQVYSYAKAGSPRSTNPTSNLLESCRMAAWAELSEMLEKDLP